MNTPLKNETVTFLATPNNQQKIKAICSTVEHHFLLEDSLLILAPSEEAAAYLDQLLWRFPESSFLPHAIAQQPTEERIAITTREENLNQARVLLSLLPNLSSIWQQFPHVYELMDTTHPEKQILSENRLKQYQKLGATIHHS